MDQSRYIVVPLANYILDESFVEKKHFDFGYFEMDEFLRQNILKFLDDWDKGILRPLMQYCEINNPVSLFNDEVFEREFTLDKFLRLKKDSVSFLKEKFELKEKSGLQLKAYFVCKADNFFIEISLSDDGNNYTEVILKSPEISYFKIKDLL